MILIAQQANGPMYAGVVARLTRARQQVLIAGSTAEAFDLIPDVRPDLVILDRPDVAACPHVLCGWIREAITPAPRLLGLTDTEDPAQRERCQRCMTLLHPGTHPAVVAAHALELLGRPAPPAPRPRMDPA